MKFVNKMVLVPYDRYTSEQKSKPTQLCEKGKLAEDEAPSISSRESREDVETISLPNKIQRHETTHRDDANEDNPMDLEVILSIIPKHLRHKASYILKRIMLSDHLRWNGRGELIIGKNTVYSSHIADLIKYILKHFHPGFTPTGAKEFIASLSENRILFNKANKKKNKTHKSTSSTKTWLSW